MKAIIPTGGRGTRMRPLTFSSNKHFLPVANKPLICYPIEAVVEAGVKDIAITYDPLGLEQVKEILGDGSKWGVKFTYVKQDKPAGLANIIEVCEEIIGEDKFFLHLGDNIFVNGIKDLVQIFDQSTTNALVTMIHHKDNRRLGVPFFDKDGNFQRYVEKPENPPNNFGIPGLYFFDKNVFGAFKGENRIKPSERGEYEIGSLYNWLMDNGYKVDAQEYEGVWLDPGKFDDWIEANRYLLDMKLKSNLKTDLDEDVIIEGRVAVGEGCEINNAQIRGPVIIGNNVKIVDSYIGPFTSVSDGCVIEMSHIENSVVMDRVKIKNVEKSIDKSLIGTESNITGCIAPASFMKFFVGEKCNIEV